MKIIKFKIQGFIPLHHLTGTIKITSEIKSDTFIIIGANGSGKSTLLRELTPMPAIRSNYLKNGYKKLWISHQGKEYVLTSDFSTPHGNHSFKVNDEELNLSGGTKIQQDLVLNHFDDFLPAILNFEMHICDMSKTERKDLLFSLTGISFALNHHKNVCSKIRALKSNIKMLIHRKTELEDKLMNPTNIEQLQSQYDKYKKGIVVLDNMIFNAESELSKQPALEQCNLDHTTIVNSANDLFLSAKKLYSRIKINKNLDQDMGQYLAEQKTIQAKQETIIKDAAECKEQIEKFESYLNGNVDEEIRECETELRV